MTRQRTAAMGAAACAGSGPAGAVEACGEPEAGTLAGPALELDIAAHELDQLPADGQAETCAAMTVGHLSLSLLEGAEQRLDGFRRDAHARVRDRETRVRRPRRSR